MAGTLLLAVGQSELLEAVTDSHPCPVPVSHATSAFRNFSHLLRPEFHKGISEEAWLPASAPQRGKPPLRYPHAFSDHPAADSWAYPSPEPTGEVAPSFSTHLP